MQLSKSKVNTYKQCPKQFRYSYIDKLPIGYNVYFDIGTSVHSFHDKLFDLVRIDGNKLIIPILKYDKPITVPGFEEHSKTITECNYNIVRHYAKKWEECLKTYDPKKHFMPVLKEKKLYMKEPDVVGIPDSIEYDLKGKLTVMEVKTGKPTTQKIIDYKNDLIWYKMLCEHNYPKWGEINQGRIYFPQDNSEYYVDLHNNDVKDLHFEIKNVRAQIEEKCFDATPNHLCNWCGYKSVCKDAK